MKKNNYILFLLLFFLSSCSTSKIQQNTDTKIIIKDSLSVVETIVYDTVILPADTIIQTFTIECDSLTGKPKPLQVSQKSGRSSQTITLNNEGILTAYCQTDSLLHIIAEKNREVAIYKAIAYTKNDTMKSSTIQYRIPKWAFYSLTVNGILVIYVFRKPLIKLTRVAFV